MRVPPLPLPLLAARCHLPSWAAVSVVLTQTLVVLGGELDAACVFAPSSHAEALSRQHVATTGIFATSNQLHCRRRFQFRIMIRLPDGPCPSLRGSTCLSSASFAAGTPVLCASVWLLVPARCAWLVPCRGARHAVLAILAAVAASSRRGPCRQGTNKSVATLVPYCTPSNPPHPVRWCNYLRV